MKELRQLILTERKAGKKVGPNSSLMNQYRSNLPMILSEFLRATTIGLMLGDVSLQLNKAGTAARLKFEWGDVKDYAFYVYSLLIDYCLDEPRRQERVNANGNIVVTWCFQTITHPAFVFLHAMFIIDGVKGIITSVLINELTPVSLAFWYMDDGSYQPDRYGLCLHRVSNWMRLNNYVLSFSQNLT